MAQYYKASICKNGHTRSFYINPQDSAPEKFCPKCGMENISECPSCGEYIRGKYKDDSFVDYNKYQTPAFCYNCGKPFPWINTALEASSMLIQEDDLLNSDEKEKAIASIPDLIVDTPKSQLAVVRIKQTLSKVGPVTLNALRDLLVDIASEAIKKSLGF